MDIHKDAISAAKELLWLFFDKHYSAEKENFFNSLEAVVDKEVWNTAAHDKASSFVHWCFY